jgi:peptidoglycan hydrolase-like protein with peptidoglycan-binding domain
MAWSGVNPEEDAMRDQIQPWPLVKQGSQGHPVPALQFLLRDQGHQVTVDGIFGPETEAAVRQFQIAEQLRADGIVGPQTWRALASSMLSV